MRTTTLPTAALALVLFFPGLVLSQTSYPMITHTTPVAVQRGRTVEVSVEGQMNFFGAYKVLVEGTGLQAEVVPARAPSANPPQRPQVRSVKLRLSVAPDAALGVREFRIATSLGVSSIGQMLVVEEPVVQESGDNNTLERANKIAAPAVVCGRIEAVEDVDHFRFHAEAGQTFTFEVHCARIQDKIHDLQKHADPMVTVYDAEGRELAANDDSSFADPLLTHTFTRSGDYIVQVRDSKYDGDPRWVYAVLVTPRPYVSHLFPMAANPGAAVTVEPVGSAKQLRPRLTVTAPSVPGLHPLRLDLDGAWTNPAPLVVSPLPQVVETEPNDAPQQAVRIAVPCGLSGRIGVRRDLDHYAFPAAKGKAIRFEVKARRFGTVLRSSLDSVLDVMTPRGQVLATNDDAFGKDAALVFTPPADGDYLLRIRDLNSKGGETFVYYLEAAEARADFTLRCDPDKAMIGPGSSTAWYAHVDRQNGFDGPVRVEVQGLPKGVTVNPLIIPPSMTQGILVLTADAVAPQDAANVRVIGTATVRRPDGKEETVVRTVTPNQEIYLPGGGRGRFDVNMQTVAVTEPSDILKVEISPQKLTLKPGGEARIEVTVVRRPDYDKSVSLDVLLRHLGGVHGNPLPPGVTIDEGKSKTLLGMGSKGHIVLRAAANAAPIDNVPIAVLAHVSVNFVVKVSYSSPVIALTVER
jgi:hypothetical protein